MEIFTNTPKVFSSRKTNLELLLSTHNKDCLACVRSGSCELQELCQRYGVDKSDRYAGVMPESEIDDMMCRARIWAISGVPGRLSW